MEARVLEKLKSRKSQRGAAALEFALVVPVLLMLVCGTIDFGMVLNGQAVVTNGARDGVRAASLGKKYAATGTIITGETSGLPNPSAVSYSVCTAATIDAAAAAWKCSSAASGNTTLYDSSRAIDAIVRVTVNYRYTWITPLPTWIGQGTTMTITQVSYMRIENT